jgi:hypothetical protein
MDITEFFGKLLERQHEKDIKNQRNSLTCMTRHTIAPVALACVPFLAVCFSVSLWDRVYPLVLGIPFNLFWLMSWIPLSSLCLWGAYRMQKSSGVNIHFRDGKGEEE